MQEISNSLRRRLWAKPQPQTHPDPDTLTAYIEQVLPAAERDSVIEHLADCRDFRDVVSLSLPELEPQPLAMQVAARQRWWVLAYRWATVAATVAIAATLIVEKPWQKATSFTPANQERTAVASDTAQPPANQVPARPTTAPTTAATSLAPKALMQPEVSRARASRESFAGPGAAGTSAGKSGQ